jgi:hypothetical protein
VGNHKRKHGTIAIEIMLPFWARHAFEEGNLPALFTLCHQRPLPGIGYWGSCRTSSSWTVECSFLSTDFGAKMSSFQVTDVISILLISHRLSFSLLLYFITLHSEFQAQINSLDIRAGFASSVCCSRNLFSS